MMSNRKDQHIVGGDAIDEVVREAVDAQLARSATQVRTDVRILREPGDRVLDLGDQREAKSGDTVLQEQGCLGEILFRLGE